MTVNHRNNLPISANKVSPKTSSRRVRNKARVERKKHKGGFIQIRTVKKPRGIWRGTKWTKTRRKNFARLHNNPNDITMLNSLVRSINYEFLEPWDVNLLSYTRKAKTVSKWARKWVERESKSFEKVGEFSFVYLVGEPAVAYRGSLWWGAPWSGW